jgi:hypothetical protein
MRDCDPLRLVVTMGGSEKLCGTDAKTLSAS